MKKNVHKKRTKNKRGLFHPKTKIKRERLDCLGRVIDISSAVIRTRLTEVETVSLKSVYGLSFILVNLSTAEETGHSITTIYIFFQVEDLNV